MHAAEIGTGTLIIGIAGAAILAAIAITVGNQSGNNSGQGSFMPSTTATSVALTTS